jgi:bacterioferritin (cytochrome b1)
MLRQDLEGEIEAIDQYKARIIEADALAMPGTSQIIREILVDEEHHANDLKAILAGVGVLANVQ